MNKQDLYIKAKSLFDANPEAKKLIMTSDGQGFLPSHEGDARTHARRNDLDVEELTRSQVDQFVSEYKKAVDAELKAAAKAEADKAKTEKAAADAAAKAEADKAKAEKAAAEAAAKAEADKAKAEKAAAEAAAKAEADKVKAEKAAAEAAAKAEAEKTKQNTGKAPKPTSNK